VLSQRDVIALNPALVLIVRALGVFIVFRQL